MSIAVTKPPAAWKGIAFVEAVTTEGGKDFVAAPDRIAVPRCPVLLVG